MAAINYAHYIDKLVAKGKFGGFTVLEAMITVALISITASVAAPSLGEFYERQKLNVGAETINSALSLARSTALSDLSEVKTCWNKATALKTVDGVGILPGRMAVFKVDPSVVVNDFAFSDSLFIDDNDGDDCVSFDTQGRLVLASISGGTLLFGICKEAGELVDSKVVTVKQTGRALTRPNVLSNGTSQINCE